MPKKVREITDLEIDEISLVDKGANQHARVTIAKRDEGEKEYSMEIYDEDGTPLDPESLDDGDVVYDEEGNGYLFELDDDADNESEYDNSEMEMVGKSAQTAAFGHFGDSAKDAAGAWSKGGSLGGRARGAVSSAGNKVWGSGASARKRKIGAGIGAAGLGTGAAGTAGYQQFKKNFSSDDLRVELSKALTDSDRDEVIAKAFGQLDEMTYAAAEAEEVAKSERDLRIFREYTEVAKSYNLPIRDDELGATLMHAAEMLSREDCIVIAKCLEAAGEAVYYEAGASGGGDNSDVFRMVDGYVDGQVSKSGSGDKYDLTSEVFNQNPELYDEYLREQKN